MNKIWIIKAGTTFPEVLRLHGDFDRWTSDALGVQQNAVEVFDVQDGRELPDPRSCRGIVITGSHAMVTDALPWSVRLQDWIPRVMEAEVPCLGICYGHQLLAQATGGYVDYHPQGSEIGTVGIMLSSSCQHDPLFQAVPDEVKGHVVHAQTVLELPPGGAVRLAYNAFEPNQAFRLGASAWGVQFHPEYSAAIMLAYIDSLSDELARAGRDIPALKQAVCETPELCQILKHFVRVIRETE